MFYNGIGYELKPTSKMIINQQDLTKAFIYSQC